MHILQNKKYNASIEVERKYKNGYFFIYHFQIYPKTVNKANFP